MVIGKQLPTIIFWPLDPIIKPEHATIMRFSNGTEFRFGTPKNSRLTARLVYVGGGCFLLSWVIGQPVKEWASGIGSLAFVAALIVLLAGTIAERKEWQAAHKIDDSK